MSSTNPGSADIFWIYDPTVLFRNGNWYRVIPTSDMTSIQKLNSLSLLFIYLTLICLLIIPGDYAYIPFIIIFLIVFYYFINYTTPTVPTRPDQEYFVPNNDYDYDYDNGFDCETDSDNDIVSPEPVIQNNLSFAKYLYDLPETCKENSANCLRYEDMRFNKYVPSFDTLSKLN